MGVDDPIYVRATINLPGLRAGREVYVDPAVPYIRTCLEARYLIPTDEPEEAADGRENTDD